MRYFISLVALLALMSLVTVAKGQAQEDDNADVQRIKVAEARQAVAEGKAIIVDVRGKDSYNSGHIKGALWIKLDDIGARARRLPRDKMIITYCT